MATTSALREFMPYGAPDLIDGATRRTFRATLSGMSVWLIGYVAILTWMITHPAVVRHERTVVVQYRELAAPPPLAAATPPPPVIAVSAPKAPAVGVPVPVPDVQAPPEQTLASQEEIAASTGTMEAGGDGEGVVVVQTPEPEVLPKWNEFVYADELPALIKDTPPEYPEVAREAVVEGEVLLRVLVGKDGRVVDVHVDKSIPMLDPAAVAAARAWVFKPALCQNRPVAVWITRRVRFSLSQP
jgi:periplasmic protein TonB